MFVYRHITYFKFKIQHPLLYYPREIGYNLHELDRLGKNDMKQRGFESEWMLILLYKEIFWINALLETRVIPEDPCEGGRFQ